MKGLTGHQAEFAAGLGRHIGLEVEVLRGIATVALLRLAAHSGERRWAELADRTLSYFRTLMRRAPSPDAARAACARFVVRGSCRRRSIIA